MTFTKPVDLSYTDMCIYIDENIYKDDYDENLVYQYLYHIMYMLAKQSSLFTKHQYYDGFALFAATRIYLRFTNRKQFELKPDGTPKMDKIRSVLNYAKNVLYPLKVDYQQSEYCQNITNKSEDNFTYDYSNAVKNAVNGLYLVEFEVTMNDICKTCENFLNITPYKKGSAEWLNVYISVMLTFLNWVTLRNKSVRRIKHLESTVRLKDSHINRSFEQEKECEPILFHLDSAMADYITVLTRHLKHIVAKDLSSILQTAVDSEMQLYEISSNSHRKEQEALDEY